MPRFPPDIKRYRFREWASSKVRRKVNSSPSKKNSIWKYFSLLGLRGPERLPLRIFPAVFTLRSPTLLSLPPLPPPHERTLSMSQPVEKNVGGRRVNLARNITASGGGKIFARRWGFVNHRGRGSKRGCAHSDVRKGAWGSCK
jgi:hypothetical protein